MAESTPLPRPNPQIRPTLGLISTWPAYQGTTIDRHVHALLKGVRAAAQDLGCNLLLGLGGSAQAERNLWQTAWPVPSAGTDFTPVGSWNTDGLIVVPDDLTESQAAYLQDLDAAGFPIIYTTMKGRGHVVTVDNAAGIHMSVTHLLQHGHTRIAFVAGKSNSGGDSAERLQAYREAMHAAGLEVDPALIAHGEHQYDVGRKAMQQILDSRSPFTAMIASNDLSCLGAMEALREAGIRVPEDVAAIGFDDILDARSHRPSLTTVRHPTFALGYQAASELLARVNGQAPESSPVVVPTRLIIRQSCGCQAGRIDPVTFPDLDVVEPPQRARALAHIMAEAAFTEAQQSTLDELEVQCQDLVTAISESIRNEDEGPLRDEIACMLEYTDRREEDAHAWQSAISALYRQADYLIPEGSQGHKQVMRLLDHARLEVSEHVQRQTSYALLEHMDMMSQLGLLTSQLTGAMDPTQSAALLAEHLPRLGIQHALVALYVASDEDPVGESEVLLCFNLPANLVGRRFRTRSFPPAGFYPQDSPLHLVVLPLAIDAQTSGFVAFSLTSMEPAAAITRNLASAIRSGRLYEEALEGRRLAEVASQMQSRFLSIVSHELRTPLSLVVGLSEMVLRESRTAPELSVSTLRDLEEIADSARHLGHLIGDVLDLASSEAGQMRLALRPLDLCKVLSDISPVAEQMAKGKGLEWRLTARASGLWVQGDSTRLRQVLLNLISNAVKFTEVGGVQVDATIVADQVVVTVTDSGIGIPPEEADAVFEDFHRTGRARHGGYGGLGLGLAICKQLVQHHGGTIGVESSGVRGSGSVFHFALPLIIPPEAPPQPVGEDCIVLVADRNDAPLWLEEQLRTSGFRVQTLLVDVGQTGWMKAVEEMPAQAIVVSDALVARYGWEIIRSFRERTHSYGGHSHGDHSHGDPIPILIYKLEPETDRGELLELNYFLKPLEMGQLTHALQRQAGPAGEAGRELSILVVDDDPEMVSLHSRLVESAGGRALEARGGREALAILERTRPDLVLLDLLMPDMDGFELMDVMRSQPATRNIPVIVVTGQTLTEADVERLHRGASAILNKGVFTADETVARIRASLARCGPLGSATQLLVRRATAFIQMHYSEPITRQDIADHVSINADYLTDCFHKELGLTPIVYLTRQRIEQAKRLLEHGNQSITEVAMAVGFTDASHFARTFSREVGVSPRAYRRGGRTPL